MAVRIRKDGRILCAAMYAAEDGDCYIDDGIHYALSVEAKVLVTESHERHKNRGEWWWINAVPQGVTIDGFYTPTSLDDARWYLMCSACDYETGFQTNAKPDCPQCRTPLKAVSK